LFPICFPFVSLIHSKELNIKIEKCLKLEKKVEDQVFTECMINKIFLDQQKDIEISKSVLVYVYTSVKVYINFLVQQHLTSTSKLTEDLFPEFFSSFNTSFGEDEERVIITLIYLINKEINMVEPEIEINVDNPQIDEVFPQLNEFLGLQHSFSKKVAPDEMQSNSQLYPSLYLVFLKFNKLDSKITTKEAHILINRMMIEHKFNNTAKEHLISLVNCFLPKGNEQFLFNTLF